MTKKQHNQAYLREKDRFNALQKAHHALVESQLNRNKKYNHAHALKASVSKNDLVYIKVQNPKVAKHINKRLMPRWTCQRNGEPFKVVEVNGAKVTILDTAKNIL